MKKAEKQLLLLISDTKSNYMDYTQEFEKMRPYNDGEVPEAIGRIIDNEQFNDILSFLYDGRDSNEVVQLFKKIGTISEFQSLFSYKAVKEIVKKTSKGLNYSGIEALDSTKPYLFIANHRDIVLDSAIMQSVLIEHGHKTTQITLSSNLVYNDFVFDLGKLNKMFTFYREGSKMQMYRNAALHSEYIRYVLTNVKESLWIAQRDGRTKDGNDKTQAALIKMLAMSKSDLIPALQELNIVPVTISYEYEPCDGQKVRERYISKTGEYIKQKGEDYYSILSGIKGYKGGIELAFGRPLNVMLNSISNRGLNTAQIMDEVLNEIDAQIYKNFALWPNNYIAADILCDTGIYANDKYTQKQKESFVDYMNTKIEPIDGDREELKKLFLDMYASPIYNVLQIQKPVTG